MERALWSVILAACLAQSAVQASDRPLKLVAYVGAAMTLTILQPAAGPESTYSVDGTIFAVDSFGGHDGCGSVLIQRDNGDEFLLLVSPDTRIYVPGPDGRPMEAPLGRLAGGVDCTATCSGSPSETCPPQLSALVLKVGFRHGPSR